MHDGMQYDSIQGQGPGHEPFKTIIIVISYGNARGRIVTREALMVLVDSDLSWWLYTERRVCSTLSVPLYGRLHGTQVPLDADGWTTVQQAGE